MENISHEVTNGSVAHYMAAIAYEKGVTTAEQQLGGIKSKRFFIFICENVAGMFMKSVNFRGKLFSQNRDPL